MSPIIYNRTHHGHHHQWAVANMDDDVAGAGTAGDTQGCRRFWHHHWHMKARFCWRQARLGQCTPESSVTTNSTGQYEFDNVSPCCYIVKAQTTGTNVEMVHPIFVIVNGSLPLVLAPDMELTVLATSTTTCTADADCSSTSSNGGWCDTTGACQAFVGLGDHCGGFITNAARCASDMHCQLSPTMPDAGGSCVGGAA